jgi:cAMP-binding proteins - catabolite gene activator and regulatory subunit of cAMP-dependent protein kinases
MEQFFDVIAKAPLFRGVEGAELRALITCLSPTYKEYGKGAPIFHQGEVVPGIGIVLSGRVLIAEDDFWGNRNILADTVPGDLFGEAYACLPGERLRVNVIAEEKCNILLLNVPRILTACPSACPFHARLIQNLLMETARKSLTLTRKLSHMVKRTTREKLLSYLSSQSVAQGSATFDIPFNRQQLADYLCVDRSAMSGELCRLRNEGVLSFERNHFQLNTPIEDFV